MARTEPDERRKENTQQREEKIRDDKDEKRIRMRMRKKMRTEKE